jgi:hypothetical protein
MYLPFPGIQRISGRAFGTSRAWLLRADPVHRRLEACTGSHSALGRRGRQSVSLRNLPLRRRSSNAQADVLPLDDVGQNHRASDTWALSRSELSLRAAKPSSAPLAASRIMPDYDGAYSSHHSPDEFYGAASAFRRAGDRDVSVSVGQHRRHGPGNRHGQPWLGEVPSMVLAIAQDSVLFAALRGGEVVLQDEEHLPGQFAG